MDFLSQSVSGSLGDASFVNEGLGICPKHNCKYRGTSRPVLAYDDQSDDSRRVTGSHFFQPKMCEACWKELHDENGLPIVKQTAVKQDYLAEFQRKKGINLKKDVIVTFSYDEELSVLRAESMRAWIFENVRAQLKVKMLNVSKYIEQRKNRFANAETKEKFLRLTYEIENADLLIIDSIADYKLGEEENFHWPLQVSKDSASFMIFSIPESESRFEDLPIKLRYRMRKAQRMSLI